ncbi:hypothetical protein [Sulfurimonas denitrificans]|uniref:hypothetical protein n=1 Tax=Sulfurimonas denitrificans TaxID=39766 RepID=UPI00031EA653|nr:hypothetical protein [Sulfurimonas denitrificans]MDD3442015.1 hypothetical protein [Sulfurimonas denitrificans]
MSDLSIKSEINKLIAESGFAKNQKLVCPIAKIFKMRHPHIDTFKICKFASQALR